MASIPRSTRDVVFLPYFGEYGHFILGYIGFVHTHTIFRNKIVCCRKGDECYFPSASRFNIIDDKVYDFVPPDAQRGWDAGSFHSYIRDVYHTIKQDFPGYDFITPVMGYRYVQFELRPKLRGLNFDIILGTRNLRKDRRRRKMNWGRWQELADLLIANGLTVGVIGREKSSFAVKGCTHSWDCGNDGDCVVEMMQNCKVYVGVDSGVSHLACFLRKPTILIPLWMSYFVDAMVDVNPDVDRMEGFDPYKGNVEVVYDKILQRLS